MDPITLGLIGLAGVGLLSLRSNSNISPDVNEKTQQNVYDALKDASKIVVPPLEQWAEVEKDGKWLVSPRYIAPVGIGEALKIAKLHGLELPDKDLVDAIWRQADLKLEPHPRGASSTPPSDFTLKTMNSPETNIAQLAYIQKQIGDRSYKLLAGTHKDVIMHGGKLGIYGWHKLDGKPIQDFFTGHSEDWKDYSQGLRLVRKVG